ncbi:hypothetical protein [Iningainema tapete]|uniref:Uncharacterized protein n=1 Tax=Iningainema tapete BLCC-T55 TaxID=2748662 RepID=A0A8J6XMS1_9CYAN|nr:hypothetical protein [Iningainema tapete]MBD2774820.1 hypothetical protein [Iningainema tapete BLCC-T55]
MEPLPNQLVTEHLELCDYKVSGYWNENNEFYEEIILPRSLSAELVSSSIGVTYRKRWIQLKFILQTTERNTNEDKSSNINSQKIGELILIYNENMEFVDENWLLDIDSPFIIAKREQHK